MKLHGTCILGRSDHSCGRSLCQETCCRPCCCQTTCCRTTCCRPSCGVSSCCRPVCCQSRGAQGVSGPLLSCVWNLWVFPEMHDGDSAPSCCAFTHWVAFEEVSGPRVLFKSVPENWGLSACGTTHEATSRISSGDRPHPEVRREGREPLQTKQGGSFSRADRGIGGVRHVAPPTWLVSNFLVKTGLILRCAMKVGNPF